MPPLSRPHLERRALEQDRDAFNRRYPVGSRIRLKPGKYPESIPDVVTTGPATILMGALVLIPVADIANVLLDHLDLGGAL